MLLFFSAPHINHHLHSIRNRCPKQSPDHWATRPERHATHLRPNIIRKHFLLHGNDGKHMQRTDQRASLHRWWGKTIKQAKLFGKPDLWTLQNVTTRAHPLFLTGRIFTSNSLPDWAVENTQRCPPSQREKGKDHAIISTSSEVVFVSPPPPFIAFSKSYFVKWSCSLFFSLIWIHFAEGILFLLTIQFIYLSILLLQLMWH